MRNSNARARDGRDPRIGPRMAALVIAGALLCMPAIWNGFPILYDDVGGYLERWPTHMPGPGRSVSYGLLLWVTASGFWIPVVILQASVTVFVVDHALDAWRSGRSPWTIVAVIAVIAATSGAAFFVSQTIPDAWAAPAVLALHLLAWHADQLSRVERGAMAVIVALAGAAHMAILGVLAGLSVIYTLAWLCRRRLRVAPSGILLSDAATGSSVALLLAANLVVTGHFALTPGGDVFLFGRLVERGFVGKVLAEECPRGDWRLCAYKSELPKLSDDFVWGAGSPLDKIGGWDDPRAKREIASITWHSIRAHPLDHIANAVAQTAEQFVTVATANNMAPVLSGHLRRTLSLYAPWLVEPFDRSRQQHGTVDLAGWSFWIVVPISIAGSIALPLVAILSWRQGHRRDAMWPAMIFLALVGNALICGVVSGPSDRYQARLAWLAPLSAVLAVLAWRMRPTHDPERIDAKVIRSRSAD